jgi:hypothetical protein
MFIFCRQAKLAQSMQICATLVKIFAPCREKRKRSVAVAQRKYGEKCGRSVFLRHPPLPRKRGKGAKGAKAQGNDPFARSSHRVFP